MTLKERRADAILGRAMTMTRLSCQARHIYLVFDHTKSIRIRLKGKIDSYSEYGMYGPEANALIGLDFDFLILDDDPDETYDEDGDAVTCQIRYDGPSGEHALDSYAASITGWSAASGNIFKSITDICTSAIANSSMMLTLQLQTNASLVEAVASGNPGLIPINEWYLVASAELRT